MVRIHDRFMRNSLSTIWYTSWLSLWRARLFSAKNLERPTRARDATLRRAMGIVEAGSLRSTLCLEPIAAADLALSVVEVVKRYDAWGTVEHDFEGRGDVSAVRGEDGCVQAGVCWDGGTKTREGATRFNETTVGPDRRKRQY